MPKRKQYSGDRYAFVTTTNPYANHSKDVQSVIRRQAMKDVGIERRIRNKQKRDQQHQEASAEQPSLSPYQCNRIITRRLSRSESCDHHPRTVNNRYGLLTAQSLLSPTSDHFDHDFFHDDSPAPEVLIPSPRLTMSLDGLDAFTIFPTDMVLSCLRIMDYLQHCFSKSIFPNIRYWWFQGVCTDAGVFRQKLSIAALHLALMEEDATAKQVAFKLNDLVIQDLKGRIANPKLSCSDGVLSIILSLPYMTLSPSRLKQRFWLYLSDRHDEWQPHVLAAYRIIAARGGVEAFDSSPALRQEIYWIDLTAAAHLDAKPRYPLPAVSASEYDGILARARADHSVGAVFRFDHRISPRLRPVLKLLQDVRSIIAARRSECKEWPYQAWADCDLTVNWLNPLTHQLLNLTLEDEKPQQIEQVCEAMRLATLLYTFALRCLPDRGVIPETTQQRKMKSLLENSDPSVWEGMMTLKLWCLAVMTLFCNDEEEAVQLREMIRRTAESRNIFSSAELRDFLGKLSWEMDLGTCVLESVWEVQRETIELVEDGYI